MDFKEISLELSEPNSFITELKFEIATARAEGAQVLRVGTQTIDKENNEKLHKQLTKSLRAMKQKGTIQFYAFSEGFLRHSTEAVFLMNKYPDYFDNSQQLEGEDVLFIKI